MSGMYHHLLHCGISFIERDEKTIVDSRKVAVTIVGNLVDLCEQQCNNNPLQMLAELSREIDRVSDSIRTQQPMESDAGVKQMSLFNDDFSAHPV